VGTHLLELLAIKEVGEELLDTGDTSRTADKHDHVNLALINASILEHLLDRIQSARESLGVEVLETGAGNLGVKVLAVEEGVDLDSGLGGVGECTLRTLAGSSQTAESTGITRDVLLGLAGELLLEMVKEVGVEVLTTEMGITGGSLDGEDTTLDVEKGDIEGTTTEIVDENVTLEI
jgi:hypothetical protein